MEHETNKISYMTLSTNVWEVAERKYENIIHQLLYNRGIIKDHYDHAAADHFFDPDFKNDLHDPFLLKNIKKAVKRFEQADQMKQKIGIFGDYDADGVPAAALLYRACRKIGLPAQVYIPAREEGYGLSQKGIDFLVANGCDLIITVDLGIRSNSEASYCREKNIDLIITDHHLPPDDLPNAFAVINPRQIGDKYPNKELSGAGVAFKLLQALSSVFPQLSEGFLKWNLDLVAISTISDVVKLIDENRVLAKFGLTVINKTKNIGLTELIKRSSLKLPLTATGVAFQIAPRINAPGRIDHATKSFELLTSEDVAEAGVLAGELNQKNDDRQSLMAKAEAQITAKIAESKLDQQPLIIVDGDWERGIIGPTASRLVERFNRPVIIFSQEDESYVGSARSVKGVNIVVLLESVGEYIEKFGGHAGAAGLTVSAELYKKFVAKILSQARESISPESFQKTISVDMEINPAEITLKLAEMLKRFEPFGMGNRRPTFLVRNIAITNYRFLGDEKKHLSFFTKAEGCLIKSIFFNANLSTEFEFDRSTFDLVCSLDVDEWGGTKKVSLVVEGIKTRCEPDNNKLSLTKVTSNEAK